jgi:CHASE3 domain sensor protein
VSRAFGQFFKFQISIFNSRVTLVSLVVLLLSGCFEEAVQESMEVTFERDGTVQVRVDVVVAHEGATPAMEQRLQQLRGELLDGRDAWARRFERVKPKGDSFGWASCAA